MRPENLPIGQVFNGPTRLIVPVYQRTYAWTREGQVETLIDFVEAKAEARLRREPAQRHFMGALILMPRSSFVFGAMTEVDIVDGQQRLTTFQLALAAYRDVAREFGLTQIVANIDGLLFNAGASGLARYKLEPTPFDGPLFRKLLDSPLDDIRATNADHYTRAGKLAVGSGPKALQAWHEVRDRAVAFCTQEGNREERLLALLQGLTQDMHLIVITLDENDDAQVIFETLNSGGEPLAAMDLVRNDVFHRAAKANADTSELMEQRWKIFEDQFWKEIDIQGRVKKPRMDFFLANVLAAETGRETLMNELYTAYKRYAKARGYASVDAELAVLCKHAPIYKQLVHPNAGPLKPIAKTLNSLDITTAYPLILAIEGAWSDRDKMAAAYRLVESYFVRRMICGLTFKNSNNLFLRFSTIARENPNGLDVLAKAFSALEGPTVVFPNDQTVVEAIRTNPIYLNLARGRLRFLLERLEIAARDDGDETFWILPDLQIEHVLPRQWRDHWPLPVGDPMQLTSAREQRLHVLGNLTLLSQPANIEVLNYGFVPTKRDRLSNSLLKLNREIAARESWNEEAIDERGRRLADLAVSVWPSIDIVVS